MPEEKRKLNAWLPVSLYNKLENAGYDNITQALIKALESFGEDTKGYNEDITGYTQDIEGYKQDINRIQKDLDKQKQDIIGYTQDIKALNNEIERLKEDLKRAPDRVEFAQLQAKNEALKMILEEKDKRIESLENDLKKADLDKEDLKAVYNNYFLQVQTLINQKAIGTGSTKEAIRKKQEETGSNQEENRKFQEAQKESRYREEEKGLFDTVQKNTDIQESKGSLETTCLNCGATFTAERKTRKFCSGKCKTAYYRKKN